MAAVDPNESAKDKLLRKISAEPLVPIGCLVTAGVLAGGIISFKRGNPKLSQKMMRYRVIAQTATLGALAYGAYVSAMNREEYSDEGYTGNLGAPTHEPATTAK
mmetsp:Transcript_12620/g.32220  ORF Transcript_12620/g.32220 Transcript_12620/m.32220 type:complete len:104 (-) Transcript_12620:332-643(-)